MKKIIVFACACFMLCIVSCNSSTKNLVGKWEAHYQSGNLMTVDFKQDGSFEASIPSEHFTVGGQYKLDNDVASFTDTTCGKNYWGKYKLTFYNNDSIYSAVIEDSCSGRKNSADKATFVRTK